MASSRDMFEPNADWMLYAVRSGIRIPSATESCRLDDIQPAVFDPVESRKAEHKSQQDWSQKHPLSSVGYVSREFAVQARDGAQIPVKVSWPKSAGHLEIRPDGTQGHAMTSLPVLFVTHGGGWIQGTHAGEERWLLWPMYEAYDLIIISVEYRLAPEHEFPTSINDCWDVFQQILSSPANFIPELGVAMDLTTIILAGSSTGACIAAVLSQKCRDKRIAVRGVILNVPVLCDYRHFPIEEFRQLNNDGTLSYEQCTTTVLDSSVMKAIWNLAVRPSPDDSRDTLVSPLHGRVENLPAHLIFVAGQDPVRDEGIYYAQKLRGRDVSVELVIYPGVPHIFAEIHELESTNKFWADLRSAMDSLLHLDSERDRDRAHKEACT